MRKEESSFCEQKEAKKLYDLGSWAVAASLPMTPREEVFCCFFSKKQFSL